MKTVPASEFVFPATPFIGLNQRGDEITIFGPGDENTPEWLALHPPAPPADEQPPEVSEDP